VGFVDGGVSEFCVWGVDHDDEYMFGTSSKYPDGFSLDIYWPTRLEHRDLHGQW
jgi:hypothetical protein